MDIADTKFLTQLSLIHFQHLNAVHACSGPPVQASWVLGPHWAGPSCAPPSLPAETPDWPATLTSSSTPCRQPHSWTCSRQQQLLILRHARLLSLKIYAAHAQLEGCISAVWITPLKRSTDGNDGGGADVARSERLRPACVFTRTLYPSHPFF